MQGVPTNHCKKLTLRLFQVQQNCLLRKVYEFRNELFCNQGLTQREYCVLHEFVTFCQGLWNFFKILVFPCQRLEFVFLEVIQVCLEYFTSVEIFAFGTPLCGRRISTRNEQRDVVF